MNAKESESGFFRGVHLELVSKLSAEQLETFGSMSDDVSRFRFVENRDDWRDFESFPTPGKSLEAAVLLKQEANKAFQSRLYDTALHIYNKSIMKAPDISEEYAIILANRSAALYHMGEYELALEDIATSKRMGYPKHLLHKIQDRKARCLLGLKKHETALKAFQETLTALDLAAIPLEQRQKWQRDVQIMIAVLQKNKAKDEELQNRTRGVSDSLENRHPVFKAASGAVNFTQSNLMGRYTEAGRTISPGQVVVIERPHCAVLLDRYANTNCSQCFKRWVRVEACPKCSCVGFCSSVCRDVALNGHHLVECPVLAAVWSSGASVTCQLALRMITQRPHRYFANIKLEESTKLRKDRKYDSSDYANVYNLVRHEGERSTGDFLHRAHMASFLFKCIKQGGYFDDFKGDNEELAKMEALIGGLLLRNLQLVQFNAHEVSQLETTSATNLDGAKSVFIGGAVYPTLALFNHSCDPSIVRYFDGTTVIARAVKTIRKGEMIGENYGPIFTETSREDRRSALKSQYRFDCRCRACAEDWPLIKDMDTTVLRFRCQETDNCSNVLAVPTDTLEFMVKCDLCDKFTNVFKGLKVLQDTETLFRLARSLKEEGKIEVALKKLIELLSLLDETLVPPFVDYHLCQQEIRTCYLSLGNKYTKVISIKK